MCADKGIGGELIVVPVEDCEAFGIKGATTDMHFTVVPFTSGTGEPVLCAIILKSNKTAAEIPVVWKFGVDITKAPIRSGNSSSSNCSYQIIKDNIASKLTNCNNTINSDPESKNDNNKMLGGGPACYYNGKQIPCFIGTSPKASITSQLLADILAHLDRHGVYDRSTGKLPLLLIDGHHSRFELPFLRYISDEAHRWIVCIGVPYGTHLWQVANSSELNGSFKSSFTKANESTLSISQIPNSAFL